MKKLHPTIAIALSLAAITAYADPTTTRITRAELTERVVQLERSTTNTSNNVQTLSTDGLSIHLSSVNGVGGGTVDIPKGEQGENGAQGPKGEQGVAGIQGAIGATGAKGEAGVAGEIGLSGIKGNAGAQGAKGETGDQGPQGEAGIAGSEGIKGPKGEDGVDGVYSLAGTGCNTKEVMTGFDSTGLPRCESM